MQRQLRWALTAHEFLGRAVRFCLWSRRSVLPESALPLCAAQTRSSLTQDHPRTAGLDHSRRTVWTTADTPPYAGSQSCKQQTMTNIRSSTLRQSKDRGTREPGNKRFRAHCAQISDLLLQIHRPQLRTFRGSEVSFDQTAEAPSIVVAGSRQAKAMQINGCSGGTQYS
jgi:hypothetical protein